MRLERKKMTTSWFSLDHMKLITGIDGNIRSYVFFYPPFFLKVWISKHILPCVQTSELFNDI